jgi:hypothetical protein
MPLVTVMPPDLRRLLRDTEFRAMMMRRPVLPDNLTRPGMSEPWHVWVLKNDMRWQRGRYYRYTDAYNVMRRKLKDPDVIDISVVSIRYLMPPPSGYRWNYRKYPWCPRCRRPSIFRLQYDHRAIPDDAEISFDEPRRCFYCGIRRAAFPRYAPR